MVLTTANAHNYTNSQRAFLLNFSGDNSFFVAIEYSLLFNLSTKITAISASFIHVNTRSNIMKFWFCLAFFI